MMAEENGFLYAETSALEGDGVSKAFKMTAEEVNTKIKDGTIALGKDVCFYNKIVNWCNMWSTLWERFEKCFT